MRNDRKDTEVIQQIKPEDLVQLVPVPEWKPLENNTDYLEVQQYMEKNSELVSTVDSQYKDYISQGRLDYEELSEKGDQLLTEWETMEDHLKGIDLIKDAEGNEIYAGGVSESDKVLIAHNKMLSKLGESISATTAEAVNDLEKLSTGYENQIKAYNDALNKNRFEK